MSKKRFTAGLESVFGSDQEETFDRGLLVDEPEKPKVKTKAATKRRKSSSRKNFTTDQISLLCSRHNPFRISEVLAIEF